MLALHTTAVDALLEFCWFVDSEFGPLGAALCGGGMWCICGGCIWWPPGCPIGIILTELLLSLTMVLMKWNEIRGSDFLLTSLLCVHRREYTRRMSNNIAHELYCCFHLICWYTASQKLYAKYQFPGDRTAKILVELHIKRIRGGCAFVLTVRMCADV